MTAPDYFREVERAFVSLRGGAAFLTPADWQVVNDWEQRGIPLSAALAGIRAVFSGRTAVSRKMPLGRCAAAVELAFDARRRQSAGTARLPPRAGGGCLEERLAALAGTLDRWTPEGGAAPPPGAAAAVAAAREQIVALARETPPDAPDSEVESRLEKIDERLLAAMEAMLGPAARGMIAQEAARALAAHRERMTDPVYRDALARAVRRRVRLALGLPSLTLPPSGPNAGARANDGFAARRPPPREGLPG